MSSKSIDSKAFLTSFGGFFSLIGYFFSFVYQNNLWLSLFVLGVSMILYAFLKKTNFTNLEPEKRKKNLILGILVLILAAVIVYITFANRFNLETMAKIKGI